MMGGMLKSKAKKNVTNNRYEKMCLPNDINLMPATQINYLYRTDIEREIGQKLLIMQYAYTHTFIDYFTCVVRWKHWTLNEKETKKMERGWTSWNYWMVYCLPHHSITLSAIMRDLRKQKRYSLFSNKILIFIYDFPLSFRWVSNFFGIDFFSWKRTWSRFRRNAFCDSLNI